MHNLIDYLFKPWPWYISGLLIGLIVPFSLVLGNKAFGISSSMRHICAACIPGKIKFFNYDWKKELWNLFFVGGILLGGIIAIFLLTYNKSIVSMDSEITYNPNQNLEITNSFAPQSLFSFAALSTLRGFIFIVIGGFFVGFGTRYANGCTSGHSIMGLSNLQVSSLIATISFMIGGVLFSWFIIPYLLKL